MKLNKIGYNKMAKIKCKSVKIFSITTFFNMKTCVKIKRDSVRKIFIKN